MCLEVGWTSREVFPEESKGVVGLLRDSIDMGNPGQVPCYCTSKVLSCFTRVKLLPWMAYVAAIGFRFLVILMGSHITLAWIE